MKTGSSFRTGLARHRGISALLGAFLCGVASAAEVEVKIKGEISGSSLRMYFEPQSLTVPAGTTVTWVNEDHDDHIVKFADHSGPRMRAHAASRPAARYSRDFPQAGSYPYQCGIHGQSMTGTIVVE